MPDLKLLSDEALIEVANQCALSDSFCFCTESQRCRRCRTLEELPGLARELLSHIAAQAEEIERCHSLMEDARSVRATDSDLQDNYHENVRIQREQYGELEATNG